MNEESKLQNYSVRFIENKEKIWQKKELPKK